MIDQNTYYLEKKSATSAGAAGVGGGTLLVVIANNLPESSKLKLWLILAAPSVSVFLGALWLWLQVKFANYLRDREARSIINDTRKTLENALSNPNTSDAHRARIRRALEKLDLVTIDRHMERIKSLKVITEEDVAKLPKLS
ncbi:hypothetical protein L0244_27690 [bacterium]|nr:hypothetical protein [bacterium]MCI0692616.1 hypothetical protein [candidate division KSB1 bacterium]